MSAPRGHYPDELPRDALAVLIGHLRGQHSDLATTVHAAYDVTGYALGQTLGPGDLHVYRAASAPPGDDEGRAEVLEDAMDQGGAAQGQAAAGAFPWKSVVLIALDLLRKLLEENRSA